MGRFLGRSGPIIGRWVGILDVVRYDSANRLALRMTLNLKHISWNVLSILLFLGGGHSRYVPNPNTRIYARWAVFGMLGADKKAMRQCVGCCMMRFCVTHRIG